MRSFNQQFQTKGFYQPEKEEKSVFQQKKSKKKKPKVIQQEEEPKVIQQKEELMVILQEEEPMVIQQEEFAKNYMPQYDKDEAIKYYDIIMSIDSLQQLTSGWEMKHKEEGFIKYQQQKDKDSCIVGIVGNGNKGKSFILQKLAGTPLPSGYSVNTEGLSVKYPVNANKNIILLDTAGLETPLLNTSAQTNDAPSIQDSYSKIGLIARDKQLTELFLQNFVITQSNILIVVFNILTYSDQKLLNRIKRDCKKKAQKLFVIHNLNTFVTIDQVTTYIDKVLMKSSTFSLEKLVMNNNDNDQILDDTRNTEFFIEKSSEKSDSPLNITHLIMANDHSEAGKYYNETTIKLLRKNCDTFTDLVKFPIIEKVKDHLFFVSKDLMEESIKSKEDIEIDESSNTIKLANRSEIVLKKCSVDELGFSNFEANAFKPKHAYYVKNNEFIIEIEVPGIVKDFAIVVSIHCEFYLFKIEGVKDYVHEKDEKMIYTNSREKGKFSLDIFIPFVDIQLKEKKVNRVERKGTDGLIILYFSLINSNNEVQKISFD